MRPVTQGYGNIASRSGEVLGQIPGLKNTMHTRFAMDALDEITRNKIDENQRKMQELGMQPQETDWLGLGMKAVSLAGGLGAFGGGGGFWGGGTTGPDPGGQTINVSPKNPTPWKGPIFGTPGSMHRI